ncbi:MAG: ferredoxin family protein [Dehalococcoidia bacterium]|jgi:NAD-dependent dihydropyrimidine dehydrogenase PreA subunit|nr:ferredoxin family protein [Dehalococcoidia bacterium]|tara:strand:- start:3561 stop:3851 length:291 start_codon:yes stop_codon:yes gene_type:complete
MTYIIAEPCVDLKDQSCIDVCPVDCIYGVDEGNDRQLYINPDECIDCAACEPVCPVNAIFAEEDVPTKWEGWIKVNYEYFEDADAARQQVNDLKPA